MKQGTLYLLSCCLVFLLGGCAKEETERPPVPVGRVLLVYMAADNNLWGSAQGNLDALAEGMRSAPEDTRTVVYLDTPGEVPRLIDVTAAGQQELYRWSSAQNSASGAVLREVIDRVRRCAPADRYGLVLWSHGMAWVPSGATGYFVKSYQRSVQPWPATKDETRPLPRRGPMEKETTRWPATKYFGQDTGVAPAGYLETAELAAALPDGVFDYILLDACFMASVEVLYALRNKADYIVSSPTEVITDGFPYARITAELLQEAPDLEAVCEAYYNYYAQHAQANYRSAAVSLVRTSELEALARDPEAGAALPDGAPADAHLLVLRPAPAGLLRVVLLRARGGLCRPERLLRHAGVVQRDKHLTMTMKYERTTCRYDTQLTYAPG